MFRWLKKFWHFESHPPAATPLEALIWEWKSSQSVLRPESEEAVKEAFRKAGGVATPDVVRLYAITGGTEDMDGNLWSLWPLKAVIEQADQGEFGVMFGDYLINSYVFRLRPVGDTHSEVLVDSCDGTRPGIAARSVDEFVEKMATDPDSVLVTPLGAADA